MSEASGAAGPPSDEAARLQYEWLAPKLSSGERSALDRIVAALASAEQRARTARAVALEEAAKAVCFGCRVGSHMSPAKLMDGLLVPEYERECRALAIRALGASPEGRGSATDG
jgi:hypothetical protein